MKVTCVGVGEAFDNNLPNNSHLVETKSTKMLLDCGYSIPQQWFRMEKPANFLDAIYISHKHADHFFGLPMLLVRMWEEERKKPLTVFCQKEHVEFFRGFTDTAYKDFPKKLKFEVLFVGVEEGQVMEFSDMKMSFAPTKHSIENLAISIISGGKKLCYSGDGQFLSATEKLYEGANLVVQETYRYDEQVIGHACMKDAIEMAERCGIKELWLTHIQRDFRAKELPKIMDKIKSDKVAIVIPEPLHKQTL